MSIAASGQNTHSYNRNSIVELKGIVHSAYNVLKINEAHAPAP